MTLEKIYTILNKVIKDKVFYGSNLYDNDDNASMPFIVYQEVSKKSARFSDNMVDWYKSNIQITLVTKKKDLKLEEKLENELTKNGLVFSLISEYRNEDKSLNRAYEITMEEI